MGSPWVSAPPTCVAVPVSCLTLPGSPEIGSPDPSGSQPAPKTPLTHLSKRGGGQATPQDPDLTRRDAHTFTHVRARRASMRVNYIPHRTSRPHSAPLRGSRWPYLGRGELGPDPCPRTDGSRPSMPRDSRTCADRVHAHARMGPGDLRPSRTARRGKSLRRRRTPQAKHARAAVGARAPGAEGRRGRPPHTAHGSKVVYHTSGASLKSA